MLLPCLLHTKCSREKICVCLFTAINKFSSLQPGQVDSDNKHMMDKCFPKCLFYKRKIKQKQKQTTLDSNKHPK